MEGCRMSLNYNVYSYDIHLDKEFRTASGALSSKKTFFIQSKDDPSKIVELPLSPSMGFTSDGFVDLLLKDPVKLSESLLVKRTISWLKADLSELKPAPSQVKIDFKTIGIGDDVPDRFDGVLKLKADRSNYEYIAQLSYRLRDIQQLWSVDFNRGLGVEDLQRFYGMASMEKCFCIEQPLPVGQIDQSLIQGFPIFLDEELETLMFERCLAIRPAGLVLKTFRHSWAEYCSWHQFAIENEIPYFVGSMVQTEIADSLCDQLNVKAPIQYLSKVQNLQVQNYIYKAQLLGEIRG